MKFIPVKNLLFFVCLIAGTTCFAQTPLQISIKGNDSLYSLQIKTDTGKKNVYLYRVYANSTSSTDTFVLSKPKLGAIKDSSKFNLAIRKFVKVDSLKRMLADTVKAYLGRSKDFKIVISLPAKSDTATVAKPDIVTGPVVEEEKGSWQILTETPALFTIFLALVIITIGLALFLFFRKPKQGGTSYIPDELVKIFPDVKNDKDDIKGTVSRIRRAYAEVKEDLDSQKGKNELVKKQLKELDEKHESVKKELAKLNEALQAAQQEVINIEKRNEQFTHLADKILDKYFRDLAIRLEQNQIKDEQEIFRLILSRLIPFSMHSASLLKTQIKDATELDAFNIQLLNGEQPKPKSVITENTQFGQADPLAHYIYKLLKKHEVEGLQEVFVKGYKIGN